jgi:23S rRNA (uracil1939-C5)-methyltransferase
VAKRKEKKIIIAKIDSMSHDGRGVAHVGGKAVFIERAITGETVEAKIMKKKKTYHKFWERVHELKVLHKHIKKSTKNEIKLGSYSMLFLITLRFEEGFVTKIIEPSPHRVTPKCQHFGYCGG